MTANAYEPGEEAGYWHTHSEIEELYVFLEGRGEMGLDDDVITVGPGTVVIPAALAMAAEYEASHDATLQAIAAGYEAMTRIGPIIFGRIWVNMMRRSP